MNIDLNRVNEADWQLVQALEEASASPYFASCENEAGVKKYLRESSVYLIMSSNEPIGTVSYKELEGVVLINGVTVLPKHRGKGIAKKAMNMLLDQFEGETFALYVHPENTPALVIYLKLGFIIKEWKENVFGDGQPRLYLLREVL